MREVGTEERVPVVQEMVQYINGIKVDRGQGLWKLPAAARLPAVYVHRIAAFL